MKKLVFSLLLSSAIFTTTPLFAMDKEQNDISNKCGVCKKSLPHTFIIDQEKETHLPPNDILAEIVLHLPLEDVVLNVSQVSKTLYNLCQHSFSWHKWIKENHMTIPEGLCAKHYVMDQLSPLNLFSNPRMVYKITIPKLLSFMKEEMSPIYNTCLKGTFKVGSKNFQIIQTSRDKNLLNKVSKFLPEGSRLPFAWRIASPDYYGTINAYFYASISYKENDENKELGYSIKEIAETKTLEKS